jgi:hypothetical protein
VAPWPVAKNVATPRINEVAMAAGNGMLPFTQRAPNSDMAATNSPANVANTLVLFLVPMRKSLPTDPEGANASRPREPGGGVRVPKRMR